jgi:hypothetical protein
VIGDIQTYSEAQISILLTRIVLVSNVYFARQYARRQRSVLETSRSMGSGQGLNVSTPDRHLNPLTRRRKSRATYRSETHSLDIIKLVDYAPPVTTAVIIVADLARSAFIAVTASEAIGHDLIDALGAPVLCIGSESGASHGRDGGESERGSHDCD